MSNVQTGVAKFRLNKEDVLVAASLDDFVREHKRL